MIEFEAFPKIPKFKRECIITEKIDGSNAQVHITVVHEDHEISAHMADPMRVAVVPVDEGVAFIRAGSRSRWITPGKGTDNFGFAQWVQHNAIELAKLGPGQHFGEWYGAGIQRTYGLDHKRFALFNTMRWGAHNPNTPACCEVVPVLHKGDLALATDILENLSLMGSSAVPGFMRPEGIIVYHSAARQMYKQVLEYDELPKALHPKKERKGDRRIWDAGSAYVGEERRYER